MGRLRRIFLIPITGKSGLWGSCPFLARDGKGEEGEGEDSGREGEGEKPWESRPHPQGPQQQPINIH